MRRAPVSRAPPFAGSPCVDVLAPSSMSKLKRQLAGLGRRGRIETGMREAATKEVVEAEHTRRPRARLDVSHRPFTERTFLLRCSKELEHTPVPHVARDRFEERRHRGV